MWAKALFTRSVHRDFIKYFSSPSWNNHATRNQYTQTYSIMQTKILPLIFYISTYKFFERSPCLKDFWRWLVLCRRVWCYQWEQGPCPGTPRDSSVSSARMTRRSSGGALQLPPSTSCQGLDRDGLPGLRGTPKEWTRHFLYNPTTFQSMMNAELNKQRFSSCHDNLTYVFVGLLLFKN